MDRRSFLMTAAASAAATGAAARPLGLVGGSIDAGGLARPELAELFPADQASAVYPRLARAIPNPRRLAEATARIDGRARLTLSPLSCLRERMAVGSGFDIEALHPAAGDALVVMYSAHTHGIGAFPAGITADAPTDRSGTTTLFVTQRNGADTRRTPIRIDARRAGSYLLAIPTGSGADAPFWRGSRVRLSAEQAPARVEESFGFGNRSCVFLGVAVRDGYNT